MERVCETVDVYMITEDRCRASSQLTVASRNSVLPRRAAKQRRRVENPQNLPCLDDNHRTRPEQNRSRYTTHFISKLMNEGVLVSKTLFSFRFWGVWY